MRPDEPDPDARMSTTPGGRSSTRLAGAVASVRGLDRPLALLAFMAFVVQIGVAVMLPLLPLYAEQFGATPIVLGLLTSAHALMSAAGQLGGGFLTERFPARRLVAAGIGLYAASNVLIATAAAALPLIVFRGLAGLGGGVNQVAERIYLSEVTDAARRATANGVLSAAGAAGTVLGPAVGGLLVVVGDLRVPFLLVAATSTVATVAALFLPRPPSEERATAVAGEEPPDASAGTETSRSSDEAPAATDLAALDADLATEAADLAPGADQAVPDAATAGSSRRRLGALFVANLALMAGFGAFITTYAIFAIGTLGWTTVDVGVTFSMFGLGSVLLGPWLARAADRTGRRRMAVVGCLPVVAFAVLFALGAPQPVVYVAAIIGGGGLTGFESAWFALLAAETDGGRRGRVFGTISALTSLGVVVGAIVAARLWESIDIHLAVLAAAVTFLVAGLAMLAYPADHVASRTEPAPA
jgi:DHA1 family tetracycline resistance protein-like MFS transporter